MNFYAFHMGDYMTATKHLSWDEDMAYRRMLDAYYSREEPLPLDLRQIYRLIGASEDRQREAVQVVLEEFFERCEDGYRNNRADEEIAKTSEKKEKARANAMLSVASRKRRSHSDGSATAERPLNDRSTDADTLPADADENSSGRLAPNPIPIPNKEREKTRARKDVAQSLVKMIEDTIDKPELTRLLDEWEVNLLHSAKGRKTLTDVQIESLEAIQGKLAAKAQEAQKSSTSGPPVSVWVWKDTPQWEAWNKVKKWPTKEARHPEGGYRPGWFFASEWPPAAQKQGQEPKVAAGAETGTGPP